MVALQVICSKSQITAVCLMVSATLKEFALVTVQLLFNNWILSHTTFSAVDCPLCFSCTLYK